MYLTLMYIIEVLAGSESFRVREFDLGVFAKCRNITKRFALLWNVDKTGLLYFDNLKYTFYGMIDCLLT